MIITYNVEDHFDLDLGHPIAKQLHYYVFYHNGVFAGSFGILDKVRRNQAHLEIYDVMINEQYRNRGLGQQMLSELLEMFGHEDLQLGVEQSNAPAYHIYTKLGFEIVRKMNVPGLGPCYWMQRLPQRTNKRRKNYAS